MSPVRKPQNHSGSFTGQFPSLKMKRMIRFESGLEKDFIYLLEFNKQVTAYEEQPLRIEYLMNKKKHTYTPDFQAKIGDENWLYECKPKRFSKTQKNLEKFGVAEKWCSEQKGWGFQVITDELIRSGCQLKNVKYLNGFSRFVIRPELIGKIYSFFQNVESAKISEIETSLSGAEYPRNEILPAIFYLTYYHKLSFPMMDAEFISPSSVIFINK